MSWTFGNIAFRWIVGKAGGMPTRPTWRRDPILIIRPLLGPGVTDASITRTGFKPWTIGGRIYIAQANVDALVALNGLQQSLTDGVTIWQAVMDLEHDLAVELADGAVGKVVFTRSSALVGGQL